MNPCVCLRRVLPRPHFTLRGLQQDLALGVLSADFNNVLWLGVRIVLRVAQAQDPRAGWQLWSLWVVALGLVLLRFSRFLELSSWGAGGDLDSTRLLHWCTGLMP